MASNDPPRRKSWRDAGTPASSPRTGGQKGWQQATPGGGTAAAPGGARKTWLAIIISAILVVVGAFIWFVLLPKNPPPLRMVLLGAGYETNLAVPHNVAGANVLNSLEAWAKDYNEGRKKDQRIEVQRHLLAARGDKPEALTQALEDCKSEVVIVVIAAHGGVDSKGVFFYRDNADDLRTDSDKSIYRLDDVLRELGNLPEKTKKLLVLDATQVDVHWASGQMHNDFARGLEKYEKQIREVPNLVVMTSSSPGELSWVTPEFRRTVFGHYFLQGLRGGVDQKGRINALGLHNYVAENVKRWSQKNRNDEQNPRLFGAEDLAGKLEIGIAGDAAEERVPSLEPLNLSGVDEVWKQVATFNGSVPSPAVFSPLPWRKYLDSALRYEELVRAGDTDAAADMQKRISTYAGQITSDREGAFKGRLSTQLTLSMPSALGVAPLSNKEREAIDRFRVPWEQKDAEFDQEVGKAVKTLTQSGGDTLRRRVLLHEATRKILMELQGEPARFVPACRALAIIAREPEVVARPAESQFAAMLYPDILEKDDCRVKELIKKKTDLLNKSIRVRLLAEEAALGLGAEAAAEKPTLPALSEYVRPHIRAAVDAADTDRRRGENLLFTTDGSRWAAAGASLERAEKGNGADSKGYADAQVRAVEMRRSLSTYYGALAELPYYTRWSGLDTDPLVALWASVHELGRQLEKPERIEDLRAARDACEKGLAVARSAIRDAESRKYADTRGDWHAVEDLLRVPFIDPKFRQTLLLDSQRISHHLLTETAAAAGATGVKLTEADRRRNAVGQGRRVLALLGRNLENRDDPAVRGVKEADTGERNWGDALQPAEEEIRRVWQGRPGRAQEAVAKASREKLDDALRTLHQAAADARLLDGAGAASPRLPDDPVRAERALLLLDLLTWQAERTYKDFWASEKEADLDGKAYYEAAATYFLNDARSQAGEKAVETRFPALLALRDKVRQQPHREMALQYQAGKTKQGEPIFKAGIVPLNLTDEPEVERIFRFVAPEIVPPGEPVMWVVSGEALEPRPDTERKAREAFGKPFTIPLIQKPRADTRFVVNTSHDVYGLYRGHIVAARTPVALWREPDVSVYQPVFERSARVAIQNTGAEAGKTSLALVVDLSSSMMFDEKGNIDQVNKPRWRRVRRAFEEVAKSLPVGVNISVRAFGPYGLGSQRISDPRVWQGFEREAARMQATLDKLEESLKLDQGTPLIRAIKDALDNDFDPRFEGFKSIIVLTDGGDSTLVEDTALQQALKTKKIDEAVKTLFPTPEISLRVIGIDPDKLTAKEQADLKPFKKAVVEVGGSYDAAESTAQIVEKLDEAVRRMRYTVEPDVGVSLPETLKKRAISISRGDKRPPENWSPEQVDFLDLDQISFLVRVQASRDFLQKVRLVPGDALFMDVAVEGDRLGLKRTVYADYLEQNRGSLDMRQRLKRSGDRDWVFSIIDMRKQERDLEMMAVIEKDEGVPDRRTETPVQQIRPQFVWFEVRGPGSDAPARLSVASRPFYPAPLWSLRCPRWDLVKEPQEPVLNAWWVESGDRLRPIARLLRNTHFASIEQVTNYPLQFTPPGENEITINVESMRLVTRDLNSEWEKLTGIPCLIVRMTYPPGTEPFFARIPDKRCGEWHRYYKAANKYVGVFWGVKFDPEGPLEIDLYSVADLKAKGLKIDPAKLTPPTVRPDPAPPDYRQISKRRSAN